MSSVEIPAYRMRGPSAFGGGARRFLNLAVLLAVTEYRLRFFDSALGYLWTLIRPLLLFGILYFVFSSVLEVDAGVEHYGVLLLMGMVLFWFFAEATGGAVTAVLDRENLVRKVHFPRIIIPLSVNLTALLNLIGNFVAVMVFIWAAGIDFRWTWLQVPFLVGGLFVFALGLAMLLSALYVPFRDIRPLWEVILQALFYATPVLYPIELLAKEYPEISKIVMLNPLAAAIQQMRHAFVGDDSQSAAFALGNGELLLVPVAITGLTFLLGLWVFNRMAPRIAEEL
ncbi:MAG TPA: ABC transporter permease [Thermoleophilaceae bacterium]|nr:ABC transporter permease [Thermoleophilaceae bacterium]